MSTTVTVAGVVALVGLAATVGSLVYLHVVPSGLSPLRNAVSQYGISPYRNGYRAATISFGVAAAALAIGIGTALHDGKQTAGVVALLIVFAVGRLVISWFPMDTPGGPRTSSGQAHGLIAIATFGSATLAAFRLGATLSGGVPWNSLATVSTVFGWVMLACVIGMVVVRRNPVARFGFGAVERGLYVAMIGWASVFAVACAARLH
jgi:hypothetical protein